MTANSAVQKSFEQAVAQHRAGRLQDAERAYAEVLRCDPSHEQAQFLNAAIALETGRTEQALKLLLALVARAPTNAVYFTNLGEAYRRSGSAERAAAALTRAVTLKPDLAQAHFNLGIVLRSLGEHETALAALVRAAELKPEDPQIQRGLANLLVEQGAHARAIGHFQCALLLSPEHAPLLLDHARCLRQLGRLEAALRAATRAVELEPENALALSEQSAVLSEQGRIDDALRASERAVALEPRSPSALVGLASALTDSGRLTEGLDAYRKLVELEPENYKAHANLVFLETFRAGSTPESILKEARAWSERHAAPLVSHARAHERERDPRRRLRVGYVSSNFNQHCQALFTLPLLREHDRSAFELYAYASGIKQDLVTRELRTQFSAWHDVTGLTPLAAAERINEPSLELWAGVLGRVQGSRLLLLAPEGSARSRLLETLRGFGVDSERVTFVSRRPRNDYLELYHGIDVCLDAIPYNGHTTSLDAFWMGVPVVTMVGHTVVGRAGLCQAYNLELPELVARDARAFRDAAAKLAGDLDALAELRAGLRERLRRSPLMDAPRFARNLENAYRYAWRRWCQP